MKSPLFLALFGAVSLSACAQSATSADKAAAPAGNAAATGTDAVVRKALKGFNPQVDVEYVGAAPFAGFREVIASGQVIYVSDDGKYLIVGNAMDIAKRTSVSENSPALIRYRADLLKGVPAADRIVFAPPNAKYTVNVFTDVECGYCRKLHSEIAEYNRQGIAVEYMAFPRMGLGTPDHKEMVSVWCAANRQQALTEAKAGKPVPDRNCKNPVETEFNLGLRLGITGTPAVFTPDGRQIGGYLAPAQMRAVLDQMAADKPAATAGGMR
ncbi:MAG TPA: thioredoxin fold domain-containing protein [Pseudoxanthomonas sp.]|nr:thioredoxin fold domain-containing protein [Pseudoxanthomonas sp.]